VVSLSRKKQKTTRVNTYGLNEKQQVHSLLLLNERNSMNTQALTKVRQLFCVDGVPAHIQRHNCRQWIKSIRFLGDKWLLAKQVGRTQ